MTASTDPAERLTGADIDNTPEPPLDPKVAVMLAPIRAAAQHESRRKPK